LEPEKPQAYGEKQQQLYVPEGFLLVEGSEEVVKKETDSEV